MNDDWVVDRWNNVVQAEGGLVACTFDGRPSDADGDDGVELARRAHLLAAAPALYRALEVCFDVLTDQPEPGGVERAVVLAAAALSRAVPDEIVLVTHVSLE